MIVLKRGAIGLGIQGLWIRRVFLILGVCLGSSIPQHGGGRRLGNLECSFTSRGSCSDNASNLSSDYAFRCCSSGGIGANHSSNYAFRGCSSGGSWIRRQWQWNLWCFGRIPGCMSAAASLVGTAPRPPMGAMPAPAAPLGTKRKSTFADVLRATPKMKGGSNWSNCCKVMGSSIGSFEFQAYRPPFESTSRSQLPNFLLWLTGCMPRLDRRPLVWLGVLWRDTTRC